MRKGFTNRGGRAVKYGICVDGVVSLAVKDVDIMQMYFKINRNYTYFIYIIIIFFTLLKIVDKMTNK